MRLHSISTLIGVFLLLTAITGCQPKPAPSPTSPVIIPPPPQANVTREYDVRDLAILVANFDDAPDFSPEPSRESRTGGDMFADEKSPAQDAQPLSRDQMIATLVSSIESTVTPAVWHAGATIRASQGRLSVTAPPETQRDLATFLADARAPRTGQVQLEMRIFDLADLPPELFGPTASKKLRVALLPTNSGRGFELTDKEMIQLLRGSQGSTKTCIINAPRMTLVSGQRAYVLVNQQHAYVSGYESKADKQGFMPQTKVAESGTIYAASAAVSEDHKQVAFDLDLKIAEFRGMGKTTFAGAPVGEKLMIDVPDMRVRELRTIASISSGNWVMFHGFRDIAAQLGWNAPSTQPTALPTAQPILTDNLIVLVKPTVIEEK